MHDENNCNQLGDQQRVGCCKFLPEKYVDQPIADQPAGAQQAKSHCRQCQLYASDKMPESGNLRPGPEPRHIRVKHCLNHVADLLRHFRHAFGNMVESGSGCSCEGANQKRICFLGQRPQAAGDVGRPGKFHERRKLGRHAVQFGAQRARNAEGFQSAKSEPQKQQGIDHLGRRPDHDKGQQVRLENECEAGQRQTQQA